MKLNKRKLFFVIYPLALMSIAMLYKYFNPLENNLFPKCLVKTTTGLDYPGWGSQRPVHHLLNGEISLAFQQNALFFILAPYLLLGFYLQLVPQTNSTEHKLKNVLYSQTALIILGIIALAYTIAKNIV